MGRALDLIGQKFERLTVLSLADTHVSPSGHRFRKWNCVCVCGNTTTVVTAALRNGNTRSCGCLQSEHARSASVIARLAAGAGRPRLDSCTYEAAHARVYRDRGAAKYWPCVDCSAPAQDWSYDHTDPDELTGMRRGGSGREFEVAYSLNPEHYSPRCRSCHVKFDKAHRKEMAFA